MQMGDRYRRKENEMEDGDEMADIRGMVLRGLMKQMDSKMGDSRMGDMAPDPMGGQMTEMELERLKKKRGPIPVGSPRG